MTRDTRRTFWWTRCPAPSVKPNAPTTTQPDPLKPEVTAFTDYQVTSTEETAESRSTRSRRAYRLALWSRVPITTAAGLVALVGGGLFAPPQAFNRRR